MHESSSEQARVEGFLIQSFLFLFGNKDAWQNAFARETVRNMELHLMSVAQACGLNLAYNIPLTIRILLDPMLGRELSGQPPISESGFLERLDARMQYHLSKHRAEITDQSAYNSLAQALIISQQILGHLSHRIQGVQLFQSFDLQTNVDGILVPGVAYTYHPVPCTVVYQDIASPQIYSTIVSGTLEDFPPDQNTLIT